MQQMNSLIAKGVVITTGLKKGVGRCSINRPITVDTTTGIATGIATVSVDDPKCLFWGADASGGVPAASRCFCLASSPSTPGIPPVPIHH